MVSNMVLILDGNSEHVAHACRKIGLCRIKKKLFISDAMHYTDLITYSLLAHIFLSYLLI